jgi:hypothetical protein
MRRALVGALALGLCAAAAPKGQPVSILPGGDSKKPISIEAERFMTAMSSSCRAIRISPAQG